MKVEELRIGDIVKYNGYTCTVEMIARGGIIQIVNKDKDIDIQTLADRVRPLSIAEKLFVSEIIPDIRENTII